MNRKRAAVVVLLAAAIGCEVLGMIITSMSAFDLLRLVVLELCSKGHVDSALLCKGKMIIDGKAEGRATFYFEPRRRAGVWSSPVVTTVLNRAKAKSWSPTATQWRPRQTVLGGYHG